ncbi:MAG TPA: HIT family protein [Candidatus Saccharibacteria bacterium]|nr:HIT family protein [Candidatus Saccharibacteria bacterium]
MHESIFAKIIKDEIPGFKIYEDENTIALLDIHPVQPGHTLVIPKQQIDHFEDLPDNLYFAVWETVKKVANRLKILNRERIGIIVDGSGVPHAHVHLIPFDTTKELVTLADMKAKPNFEELEKMSKKLYFKEAK